METIKWQLLRSLLHPMEAKWAMGAVWLRSESRDMDMRLELRPGFDVPI
jgi:hypothetical protein